MPKFRRKPTVVEAHQYTLGVPIEGLVEKPEKTDPATRKVVPAYGLIKTETGWVPVAHKDWVVKDDKGRISVMTDAAFKSSYESA